MSQAESLAAFQRRFAAALFADVGSDAADAVATQPGFIVYRNTVMRGAVDALAANHPTVAQLVGVEWFEHVAARFVSTNLPRDGSLALYGVGFADFLAAFAPSGELPYLADVARLDRAWTEAHLAADAPVLTARDLAGLSPQALLDAVLVPHPAARWLRFESSPAFTIWRRHREGSPTFDDLAWRGESGLVVRPFGEVTWHAIDVGVVSFLQACARGLCFADASDAADAVEVADCADADAASPSVAWLPGLVAAGAFTRVEARKR
ncbi:MAG: DNA-binding domain-containing protein [Caldimonas sp.]